MRSFWWLFLCSFSKGEDLSLWLNTPNLLAVLCPKKDIHVNDTIVIHEKTFDALGPAWDLHNTVPVFLALLIFPFLNFNSTTFFTKFNSLGTRDNFKHISLSYFKLPLRYFRDSRDVLFTRWLIQSVWIALCCKMFNIYISYRNGVNCICGHFRADKIRIVGHQYGSTRLGDEHRITAHVSGSYRDTGDVVLHSQHHNHCNAK